MGACASRPHDISIRTRSCTQSRAPVHVPVHTSEPTPPEGYTLVRKLGHGGEGETYLARETCSGALYALKFVRRSPKLNTRHVLAEIRIQRYDPSLNIHECTPAFQRGDHSVWHATTHEPAASRPFMREQTYMFKTIIWSICPLGNGQFTSICRVHYCIRLWALRLYIDSCTYRSLFKGVP